MPELPEVDLARRQLERWLAGRKIVEVSAHPGTPLRQTKPRDLIRLQGHKLQSVTRRGKHLGLRFDRGLAVHLHLGMTGKIVCRERGAPEPRFSKVCFRLARSEVHFCDSRRFGRFRLLSTKALDELPELRALGPDAWLDPPSAVELGRRLSRGRRQLKVALLDQTVVAGLGNIHVVEALWRARLSPLVRANTLNARELEALRKGIHDSLAYAMSHLDLDPVVGDVRYVEEGAPNRFKVYDREGEPCRRKDHTPI